MIPDIPNLSDPVVPADFIEPNRRRKAALVDYARGGVALLDASRGLNVKTWTCEARSDGVFLSAAGVTESLIDTVPENLVWISLAFDQNMHYNVVYILDTNEAALYFYDATIQQYSTLNLGDVSAPIIRMDDVILPATSDCELVLSYIKNRNLCVRVQRDRFSVEYVVAEDVGEEIIQCGMNSKRRFQWSIKSS